LIVTSLSLTPAVRADLRRRRSAGNFQNAVFQVLAEEKYKVFSRLTRHVAKVVNAGRRESLAAVTCGGQVVGCARGRM